MNLDRSIDKILDRLNRIDKSKDGLAANEDDIEIEARFAKLREARAKKTDAFGNKTYEDVWDNMTQEEIDYYKRKTLEISCISVKDVMGYTILHTG